MIGLIIIYVKMIIHIKSVESEEYILNININNDSIEDIIEIYEDVDI